jgi:WASH complex subunit 7
MNSTLKKACDTSFLYFHSHLLPVIVSGIYLEPTSANRLQYISTAFCDAIKLCECVRHSEQTPFVLNLRKNIHEVIKSQIIEPLSRDIETDLRLNIHIKHLDHMQTVNPKTADMKPLRPFIDLPPIRILGLLIDVKREVTHYLDRNFYNLTTVVRISYS